MSDEAMKEMPVYKSHKRVWALQIAELRGTGTREQEDDGSLWMLPAGEGFGEVRLSADYVIKHGPQVGGYYVVYDDGYKSFSPAKAFEEGYTLVE